MIHLQRVFSFSKEEWSSVRSSFLYFFFLMSSYFILRPVRDEMGIQAGVENMQWLFTATFLVMIIIVPVFGYLMRMVPRDRLLIRIYMFFAGNIFLYFLLFQQGPTAILSASFFVWLSVFNLFVISLFWSFNADIFSSEQAKRLYGPIAAGGSMGAIFGPLIATTLVESIGVVNLLLISSVLLLIATYFLRDLINKSETSRRLHPQSMSTSSIWQGLILMWKSTYLKQIGLFILLYTSVSTFLYFEQAHIVSKAYDSAIDRTWYFGTRDLLVNSLTLIFQFFITERILRKLEISRALTIVPMVAVVGFFALGIHQSVIALLVVQVCYRVLNFSVQRPSREVLFTRLSVGEKYNTKNFIDTAVYRGGDALSGWLFAGFITMISSLQIISLLVIPIAVVWMFSGFRIGKMFKAAQLKISRNENNTIITKKSA